MKCPICNSKMSEPVQELFAFPSVTSDCRPWHAGRSVRICSDCGVMRRVVKDGADFHSIYDGYKSYPEPEGRTKKILEFTEDRISIPRSILDIGSGEGAALDVLFSRNPDALVHGFDPHSSNEWVLKVRPVGQKYDLVTMFHVLEHVGDLHEMLTYVKSVLSENGHLLIQVPYTEMWPFDLILADHEWHFSPKSLTRLLYNSGFRLRSIGNEPIQKEFTILANLAAPVLPEVKQIPTGESIDWILSYKKFLNTVNDTVAVYGTGPAAAWAGSILGDKVVCYIDDDLSRRRIEFNGKSVEHPAALKYRQVVAPFPDWQLTPIKAKNPELIFL